MKKIKLLLCGALSGLLVFGSFMPALIVSADEGEEFPPSDGEEEWYDDEYDDWWQGGINDAFEEVYNEMDANPDKDNYTIKLSGDFALPLWVMKELQYNDRYTLEYSLNYKGIIHKIIIPGGYEVADDDILWYGPEYLIGKFENGNTAGLKKFVYEGNYYVVQEGDTINSIAEQLDIPADDLLRINDLDDPKEIYPGMQLNY